MAILTQQLPTLARIPMVLFVVQWLLCYTDGLVANNNRNKRHLPLRKRRPSEALMIEQGLLKKGYRCIIGSDESGTGCIAGPIVTASCCYLPRDDDDDDDDKSIFMIEGVDDSKLLTQDERRDIFNQIQKHPEVFVWAVATRSNQVIDETSLEQATKECFHDCIENVVQQVKEREIITNLEDDNFYSIVDGHKNPPKLTIPSRAWKGGDEVVYTVALASIIARCHHETVMEDIAAEHTNFQFDLNGGYPTRQHIEALHAHGPSSVHRQSCKPVKDRL